jgi:hypothetical protein
MWMVSPRQGIHSELEENQHCTQTIGGVCRDSWQSVEWVDVISNSKQRNWLNSIKRIELCQSVCLSVLLWDLCDHDVLMTLIMANLRTFLKHSCFTHCRVQAVFKIRYPFRCSVSATVSQSVITFTPHETVLKSTREQLAKRRVKFKGYKSNLTR